MPQFGFAPNGDESVKNALKSIKTSKETKYFHYSVLASSYAESGDFKKAIESQEKAISILNEKQVKIKESYMKRINIFRNEVPYRFDNQNRER